MATKFALHMDVEELKKRGVALGDLAGGDVGKAIVLALNETVDGAYDLSRKRMTDRLNISQSYIENKMGITRATQAKPVAVLVAEGTETLLRNFGANLLLTPRKTQRPNHNEGKLGIPLGMKQYGTSVAVTKDGRQRFPMTFMLPLNAGKVAGGNGIAVFTRAPGAKKPRVMLGPAVYQLFKYQLNGTLLGETEDALAEALSKQVEIAMQKALES